MAIDHDFQSGGWAMRKADIANTICEKVGVSKTEAMDMVEYILDILKVWTSKSGEAIKIAGIWQLSLCGARGNEKGEILVPGKKLRLLQGEWSPFVQANCLKSMSIPKLAKP